MTRSSISLLLLFALTIAACTGRGAGGDDAAAPDLRVVFVTHGQASDPFWSVVQNGARQAGHDLRVRVEYQAPESFDMVVMAQLIDAAVASNPDGLVVSVPDVDALGPAVREAIDAGIPVVSINSGNDVVKALGVLIHVGQTEYEAGYGGGQQMAAAGVTKAFCVNQEAFGVLPLFSGGGVPQGRRGRLVQAFSCMTGFSRHPGDPRVDYGQRENLSGLCSQ